MRSRTIKNSVLCAGLLGSLAMTGQAFAQATPLNIGGSSAGKNFATDVPLDLCDPNTSPLPHHYSTADLNKHVWVCKRGGSDIIIRYSATGSSDGVNKLLVPATNPGSFMDFLDHTLTLGCTTVTGVVRAVDNRGYDDTTGCNNANIVVGGLPVHMGASDVQGASFHQVGPVNPTPPGPPITVSPLNDGSLQSVQIAIVPFSMFVGKGVVKVSGGLPNGQIADLTRLEIEAIFNKQVTDWTQLGLGTVTDGAPGTLEGTSPIVICLRNAGSGTKATFDETVMINQPEATLAIPGSTVFSSSTSGVLTCLAGNRRAIGYMDQDQIVQFTNATLPNGNPNPNLGLGYSIGIDGHKAYDPSLTDKKRDLKCGRYPYWAGWRLNRRVGGEPDNNINTLAAAFVTDAGLQNTISLIPTGAYWASDEEMFVSKNQDRGPLLYKAGAHTACN